MLYIPAYIQTRPFIHKFFVHCNTQSSRHYRPFERACQHAHYCNKVSLALWRRRNSPSRMSGNIVGRMTASQVTRCSGVPLKRPPLFRAWSGREWTPGNARKWIWAFLQCAEKNSGMSLVLDFIWILLESVWSFGRYFLYYHFYLSVWPLNSPSLYHSIFFLSASLFISLSIPLPAPRSHRLPRSMGMPGRAFTISRSPLSGREMWSFLAVIIIVISPPSRSATRS